MGFTLVELMVAMALAGMLMLGITILYMTAQRNWLEASSKLMLQQNATMMLQTITDPIRSAHWFEYPADVADSSAVFLQWCDKQHSLAGHWWLRKFYWSPTDSLVHMSIGDKSGGYPPETGPSISNVKVSRLRFAGVVGRPNVLRVTSLKVRDSYGQTVELSSQAVMQNFVD